MYLDYHFKSRNKQQGISMAFLLFAIVIISLLAAAIMRINSGSNVSNVHQVISTRAFLAAESGAQLQALAIFPVSGVTSCSNINFTINGCNAITICNQITIDSTNYYQVVSTAQCNAGQPLQATRTIEVRLKQLN